MGARFRPLPAAIAVALLSLATTSSVLAVRQSAPLTIRITRPSAATITLVSHAGMPTAVSGSLSSSGLSGSESLCYASAERAASTDCVSWTSASVAFRLPLAELSPDIDVVATAS